MRANFGCCKGKGGRTPRKRPERAVVARLSEIQIRNFIAPLRAVKDDTDTTAADEADAELSTQQQTKPVPKGLGRPPPIVLTTSINLMEFRGK
jgi:hypothetical protein